MKNTKDSILLCAKELFSAHGYGNVSMREIIRTCHIPTGTLYKYFKNKDDLLYHLRIYEIEGMVHKAVEMAGEEHLLILAFHFHNLFTFIQENEVYAEALFKPNSKFYYEDSFSPKLMELEKMCFKTYTQHFTSEDRHHRSIIIQGIVENIANHFFEGLDSDLSELVILVIRTVYGLFNVPTEVIDQLIEKFKKKAGF